MCGVREKFDAIMRSGRLRRRGGLQHQHPPLLLFAECVKATVILVSCQGYFCAGNTGPQADPHYGLQRTGA